MARRHERVEHAILTLVLRHGDHQGYSNTLGGLAAILRDTFSDIDNREVVDALKRLMPKYLMLCKWSEAQHQFVKYPDQTPDDDQFFYRGDFSMRRTPNTDPRVQILQDRIDMPSNQPRRRIETQQETEAHEVSAKPTPNPPSAFVSYAWDDDAHHAWVKQISSRLRSDGVNVTLDQWHLAPGDRLPVFME